MKNQYYKIFLLFLLLSAFRAEAQYNMNIMPFGPLGPDIQNPVNLSIVSTNNTTVSCFIKCEVLDEFQNPLLELKTTVFPVSKGINTINNRNAAISSRNYYSESFRSATEQGRRFPVGKYHICYALLLYEANTELAKVCEDFEAMPIQPPRLLYPDDNALLQMNMPVLTWLAPIPSSVTDKIYYELRLAEILSGQSETEALETNSRMLDVKNLGYNFFAYPPSAPKLMDGKTYAWQVNAFAGGNLIGTTEIWKFSIPIHKIKNDSAGEKGPFAIVRTKVDGGFYLARGYLKFQFEGDYAPGKLDYKITNEMGQDVTPKRLKIAQQHGSNQYDINLLHEPGITDNQYYLLTLTSRKGEHYFLRFQYKNLQ